MHTVHRTTALARRRRGLRTAVVGLGLLSLLGVVGISAAAENDPVPVVSITDLAQLRDTIVSKLEAADLVGVQGFGVFLDPSAGRVLVDLFVEKDNAVLRKLAEAVIGKVATLTITEGTPSPHDDFRAGETINNPGCTAGFAITTQDSGDDDSDGDGGGDGGFLTAGHCFDATKPARDQLFFMDGITMSGKEFRFSGTADITDYGIIGLRTTRHSTLPQLTDGLSVTGFEDNPQIGMRICKIGRTTGKTCGEITGIDGTITYPAKKTHKAAKVRHVIMSNLCAASGDSGGPVFTEPGPGQTGVRAVGIHSGGRRSTKAKLCGLIPGQPDIGYAVAMSTDPEKSDIPVRSTDPMAPYSLKVSATVPAPPAPPALPTQPAT